MRVLVCGGRYYGVGRGNDHEKLTVFHTLKGVHARRWITHLIEGGAPGADACARAFAQQEGIAVSTYSADWAEQGRAAGPIRNQRMIDEGKPDLVVAFSGGAGTADMVRRARAAGIEVRDLRAVSVLKTGLVLR